MKWTIPLSIALVISIYSVAFADSILTLVAEPAHTVGPQSSSNPCIIAATTCKQDTSVFDYDNYTQKGSIPSYNEFSPTYTNAQILTLFPNLAFNIAIDVNTADNGEILDLFEVFINCSDPSCSTGTRIYHYDADGNIGSLSANGNGYADWTLRTVDLTGLTFTNIEFHAIWNNASDGGESFFLVSGTPNQGCTTNCFPPTVPEPPALILMGLGLFFIPSVVRMNLRYKRRPSA
jgi:hypothetical protein